MYIPAVAAMAPINYRLNFVSANRRIFIEAQLGDGLIYYHE